MMLRRVGPTVFPGALTSERPRIRSFADMAFPGGGGAGALPFRPSVASVRPLTPYDGRHRTLTPCVVPLGHKWLMVYRDAATHTTDVSTSTLKLQVSADRGHSWSAAETLYSEPGIDPGWPVGRQMAGGRVGFICRRHNGSTHLAPVFIYSDDGGETWTSEMLDGVNHPSGWTGGTLQMHRFPASVGGHDDDGFCLYSANQTSTGNIVQCLRTTDNGETWESDAVVGPITGVQLATIGVARMGDTDRWVMIARQAQGGDNSLPALAFKSTDMVGWSGPYSTGQNLANNPHNVIYWRGLIYLLGTSRGLFGDGPGGRPLGPISDGFVHQWADAETLWNASFTSGWPGWSALIEAFGMEGHPSFVFTLDYPLATFGYSRPFATAGTRIGVLDSSPFARV